MNKLKDINRCVKITLNKLPGIRADLVRMDDDWQDILSYLKLFGNGSKVIQRYFFLLIKT